MGVYFNGRYYIKPQVASYVDDSALMPVGLVGANVIGMVGPAKEGVPNQGYLVTSIKDATDIFSEGPLVDGIMMAFNAGAQFIWAVRIGGQYNSTTHAFSSAPERAAYGPTGAHDLPFKLWTTMYGAHANGARAIFSANATKGYDISVSALGNTFSTTQGVYSDAAKILNNTGTTLTVTIAKNLTAYNMSITDGTNSITPIDLTAVANMMDLGSRISTALAAATPAPIVGVTYTSLNNSTRPVTLDAGVTSITNGNSALLQNNCFAVYNWFVAQQQPYISAQDTNNIFTTSENKDAQLFAQLTVAHGAITAGPFTVGETITWAGGGRGTFVATAGNVMTLKGANGLPPTTTLLTGGTSGATTTTSAAGVWVYFDLIGGTYGTADATSYQGVLTEIFESTDLDLVVPIVDDYLVYSLTASTTPDSIFQYTYSHCKFMSEQGGDERMGFVGYQFGQDDGNADTLTSTLMGKATNFNSPYIVIASPRFKAFDLKGTLKYFNGTYTAAYMAGLVSSYSVGEPITHKVVSGITGLSTVFKDRQIIQLIDNGVLTVERLPNGTLRVVQGITTWLNDDNFNKKEISVRLATNYIAKNCRANLDQFVGQKNSPFVLQTIKGALIQVLRDLEAAQVIVGTPQYPAYRNIIISANGDVVNVSFECSPVLPINYVLITVHATIFKATI